MTREDAAWAAGYFEGEGSVSTSRHYTHRDGTRRERKTWHLRIQVGSTDVEPLERLSLLFGGNLNGPYQDERRRWKPHWRWTLSAQADVERFIQAVYPWLSPRRQEQLDGKRREIHAISE